MARELIAGAAEVNITPRMGVEMCGYGPNEKRVCTDVLDPLYARALWFENGDDAVLIISVDLCTVDRTIRDRAAAEISSRCGIPAQNVMVAASHTHSGPSAQMLIGWGERDPDYVACLPRMLVEAACGAKKNAQPASVGSCRQRVWNVGVNREQPELAPLDPAAQLMRVNRADGSPLAVVFNFGAHAVTRYPFTSRISADWPGLAASILRYELGGAIALFLQGPCGNINGSRVIFDRRDPESWQKVCDAQAGWTAMHFCEQVLPAVRRLQTRAEGVLRAELRTINLPCTKPDRGELERTVAANEKTADSMTLKALRPLHERIRNETEEEIAWRRARFEVDACRHQLNLLDEGKECVEAPLHLLRIGEAVIVGWPGEIFVELGLEVRQRSPHPLTFVSSVTNHCVGYVPTEAAYESQGRPNQFGVYPARMTPRIFGTLPLRRDVGRLLVEETVRGLAVL
jgi:neutral ceramidase